MTSGRAATVCDRSPPPSCIRMIVPGRACMQHPARDHRRAGPGPVGRVHVPQHDRGAPPAQPAQHVRAARPVRRPEQPGPGAAGRPADRLIGPVQLLGQLGAGQVGQERMRPGVVAQPVPGRGHPGYLRGVRAGLQPDAEERGRHLVPGQDAEDLPGVGRVRAVVEGERDLRYRARSAGRRPARRPCRASRPAPASAVACARLPAIPARCSAPRPVSVPPCAVSRSARSGHGRAASASARAGTEPSSGRPGSSHGSAR